jgi:uncharacterized protein (DUF58 family)
MIPGVDLEVEALLKLRHLAYRMRDIRTLPRSTMPGDIIHRRRGRGLEVHDVRPWSEGDDIRHLDQNATARTGQPHTKTYFDERERSILLLADFRPSMLFGTKRAFRSVAAAEALAMLGWRGVGRGGRVGLIAANAGGTRFSRQGRGERAMIAHVGVLAEAHREALADRTERDPPLTDQLETAERLAGTGSTIVVATALDTPGTGFDDIVSRITRRHDLVFLLVEDEFERAPPAGDYPFTTADGGSGWMRILKTARRKTPQDRIAALRRLGAQAAWLSAAVPAEHSVQTLEQIDG